MKECVGRYFWQRRRGSGNRQGPGVSLWMNILGNMLCEAAGSAYKGNSMLLNTTPSRSFFFPSGPWTILRNRQNFHTASTLLTALKAARLDNMLVSLAFRSGKCAVPDLGGAGCACHVVSTTNVSLRPQRRLTPSFETMNDPRVLLEDPDHCVEMLLRRIIQKLFHVMAGWCLALHKPYISKSVSSTGQIYY